MLLTTACVLAAPARAQDAPQLPPETPTTQTEGGLNAGVEINAGYDDNVYATRNREADDIYLTVRPFVRGELGSGATTLTLRGEGEIGRYADLTSEDYEDWSLAGDGRARLAKDLTLIAGAEWRWDHESRASPEAVSGTTPTEYQRGFGYLGLLGSSGRYSGRLGGTVTRYDFDDVAGSGGIINNDDRDRVQGEVGARSGLALASGTQVFAQAAYNWRDYDDRFDDRGFRRNSDGYTVTAGLRGKLGSEWSGEIFGGWMRQDYRDPLLPDVSTWDFGAVLDWNGRNGLGGSLRVDRSVEETTLPGASGYILTSGRLSLRSDAGPRLSVGLGISGYHYDYIGNPRTEFVLGGDLWARYWFDRHLYVRASFVHNERSSNAAGFDYEQNRFLVGIGAQLNPHFAADTPRLTLGGAAPGGAYAGLLLGHGTLVAGIDGPRGPGGNTADFGDHGASAIAVAGYGFLAGSVYLGLEAEAALAGPDWLHSADRVFSMDKRNALGISARVGWATQRDDLVYGRFGLSSTDFRSDYTHQANAFSGKDRRTGLATGFGVETSAGSRGFLRAEYVITSYDDYDVPTGGGNFDNFSANETQFRFGGGIRFGQAARAEDALPPVMFGGRYVGLQIGHGSLISSNQGTRSGGTQLDVTRASRGGLIGLYAGHGTIIQRGYLGVEAEGDVSAINWNIERDPNGRTYSAEHDYSFGGSARAGVLVGDSALVYGRIGVVRTRFDIRYATTSVSVRAKETRTGVRYGGGLEIGLGGRARLRMDYTVTDYDRYDVRYGNNSDRFDHSEDLFRIGVSWRI